MKLEIEIGKDEELRKMILKLVEKQVNNLTADEIRQMAREHLSNVNVAAKTTSTIKDLLNRQIDYLTQGYGKAVMQQKMESKMNNWLDQNFEKYFDEKCKPFLRDYLEGKLNSFESFLEKVKDVKG